MVSGTATTWIGSKRMHFEVLVEDKSGSIALDVLLKMILGLNGHDHSWKLHPYKGIGRIPKNLHALPNPKKKFLLNHLPMLLRGYGQSLRLGHGCVVVVVDLDTEDCVAFKQELLGVLATCRPPPTTLFRIAIEESEAWLLGDRDAVKAAYPKAKDPVLSGYKQDSIWSLLKCVWVAAAPVLCLHSRGTASRSTRRASGSHRRDARSPAACC